MQEVLVELFRFKSDDGKALSIFILSAAVVICCLVLAQSSSFKAKQARIEAEIALKIESCTKEYNVVGSNPTYTHYIKTDWCGDAGEDELVRTPSTVQ